MPRLFLLFALIIPVTARAESGRELFDALEQTLLDARNVRIGAVVMATGAVNAELDGELQVVQNMDRVSFGFRGVFNDRRWTAELFSNGENMRWRTDESFHDVPTPPELNESLLLGLTRMGVLHNIAVIGGGEPPDHAGGGVTEWVQADGFSEPETTELNGRKARKFGFDITVAGKPSGSAVLWLDAERGLPMRREQTVYFEDGRMDVVEIYRDVVLNASVVTESKAFRTDY